MEPKLSRRKLCVSQTWDYPSRQVCVLIIPFCVPDTVFAIGILSTVVLKFLNYSVNPLWCIVDKDSNGWNKTGLVLALLAYTEKSLRPNRLEPQPPSAISAPANVTPVQNGTAIRTNFASSHPGLVACGFGSLIFLIQTFISDASTIITWNWSGYPVKDQPTYMDHVPVVISCAAVAIIQPFAFELYRNVLGRDLQNPRIRSYMDRTQDRQRIFGIIAFAACIALCSRTASWAPQELALSILNERNGFIAGCVVIAYILQALPRYFQGMSALRSYKHFGHAMLLYVVLDVLSVVTVAYAFVPGGQLFRERGGLVISVAFLLTVLGDYYLPKSENGRHSSSKSKAPSSRVQRYGAVTLGLLAACSWIFQYRFQHGLTTKAYTTVSAPGKPESLFTAAIWTVNLNSSIILATDLILLVVGFPQVHFGVDLAGRESQNRQLELIRDLGLDVIGLLESDLHRFVYGNRDLTRMLVEEMGYNVDLGPGPNKHTWGAALLSRYPILESRHLLLPSPHGELAPAIHAKLLIANQTINVIVSHNGQEEDALDRQLQSEALARVMSQAHPEPFLFLGYVVTHVGAKRPAPYEIL